MGLSVFLWVVLLPASVAGTVLVVGWRPWRRGGTGSVGDPLPASQAWAAGIAVSAGYIVGHWGRFGGPGQAVGVDLWLIYLAAGAGILAAIEPWLSRMAGLRWAIRVGLSVAATWVLMQPLIQHTWSNREAAVWLSAGALAMFFVWTAIDRVASAASGALIVLLMMVLTIGSSVALVLSASASTGEAAGIVTSTLGAVFLVAWRYPLPGQLRSLAPVLAVLLVGQWTIALCYAQMPKPTYVLLVASAGAFLLGGIGSLPQMPWLRQLVIRALLLVMPLGAGIGVAFSQYFSEPPADAQEAPDEDYGYD